MHTVDDILLWSLLEDRTIKDIRTEVLATMAYIRQLTTQVQKKKKSKKFTGKLSAKDLLLKQNPHLSDKISVPEYRLGKSLEALLTPHNFAFFADKVPLVGPEGSKDQGELFGAKEVNAHALVLDMDSLQPMWKQARKRIYELIHDYVGVMNMSVELPKAQKELATALRQLASAVVSLYQDADPNAADDITKQAHRKLMDHTLMRATDAEAEPDAHVVSPAVLEASHAYRVLLAEKNAKKITQAEFVRAIAALVAKLPPEDKQHWVRSTATQNNYHVGYAKYLSQHIAPLVATLDTAFDARALMRVMGHGFEPDYLLKDLNGNTVWGEYLGMAIEQSSGGTHYNIRSEFKKMGYGKKGVFFFPHHLGRFPNPELMAVLQQANVVGFDQKNSQYFVMVNGKKDFIIPKGVKTP